MGSDTSKKNLPEAGARSGTGAASVVPFILSVLPSTAQPDSELAFENPDPNAFGGSGAFEQVMGPIYGHYLACYTVRDPEGVRAYVKVCLECPADVWDTQLPYMKIAGPVCFDKLEAVRKAVELACLRISVGSVERTSGWMAEELNPGD